MFLFIYSEKKYTLIFSFCTLKHSHVLDCIERDENIMFVIKIRKVSIARPEFSEDKEFLSVSFISMSPGARTVPGA